MIKNVSEILQLVGNIVFFGRPGSEATGNDGMVE